METKTTATLTGAEIADLIRNLRTHADPAHLQTAIDALCEDAGPDHLRHTALKLLERANTADGAEQTPQPSIRQLVESLRAQADLVTGLEMTAEPGPFRNAAAALEAVGHEAAVLRQQRNAAEDKLRAINAEHAWWSVGAYEQLEWLQRHTPTPEAIPHRQPVRLTMRDALDLIRDETTGLYTMGLEADQQAQYDALKAIAAIVFGALHGPEAAAIETDD
jgi:hypothetical protein